MPSAPQRAIPSVDKLLQHLGPCRLARPLVLDVVRRHLDACREAGEIPPFSELVEHLDRELSRLARQRLQPVVNATGILAHTNLGRAPLSIEAVQALAEVGFGYCNLEIDLETGARGSRASYLEAAIALATGAEAATVVNNGAAALVLALRHFARGARREVIVSRGELVQIGGGFRIPEILETSGAILREVGTTNQTTLEDYSRAVSERTAVILRVHRSNFFMEGFVDSPSIGDLASMARRREIEFGPEGLPVIEDLGSGAWIDLNRLASVPPEPVPATSLGAGADLVCFSGDKLLGGPQAGILVGRARHVAALRRDPFFRALRCDKLVFAALQATVEAYLEARSRRDALPPLRIPILGMLAESVASLRTRAEAIVPRLSAFDGTVELVETSARIGGGVCPRSRVPSIALALRPRSTSVEALALALRRHVPPVVGFVRDQALCLDLRTVFPAQDGILVDAISANSSIRSTSDDSHPPV